MYSINFWLRYQNGIDSKTPIYCRIKINGLSADFFTGLKIHSEHFDKEKQRFNIRKNKNYIIDNESLDSIYEDLKKIIVRNPTFSAKDVKDFYIKKDVRQSTLVEIFDMYLQQVVYIKGLEIGTIKKWQNVKKHLDEYFKKQNFVKESSGIELYNYVKTKKKSSNNHAVRSVKYFCTAMDWAVKKGLLKENKMDVSGLRRDNKSEVKFLEDYQTKKLIEIPLNGGIEEIRDLFIFICFTGFDYCDFKDFDPKRDVDFVQKRIYWNRGKNTNERILPLFPEARRIIEKYNYKLPVVTNTSFNKTLKVFGTWLGLKFGLTTKIGRKTAGMWLLNEGVPMEVVQVILGHKDIRTTQRYYARILPKSVFRATAHLV